MFDHREDEKETDLMVAPPTELELSITKALERLGIRGKSRTPATPAPPYQSPAGYYPPLQGPQASAAGQAQRGTSSCFTYGEQGHYAHNYTRGSNRGVGNGRSNTNTNAGNGPSNGNWNASPNNGWNGPLNGPLNGNWNAGPQNYGNGGWNESPNGNWNGPPNDYWNGSPNGYWKGPPNGNWSGLPNGNWGGGPGNGNNQNVPPQNQGSNADLQAFSMQGQAQAAPATRAGRLVRRPRDYSDTSPATRRPRIDQPDDPTTAARSNHHQPRVEENPDTQGSETVHGTPIAQASIRGPAQAQPNAPAPPPSAPATQPTEPSPLPALIIIYTPPTPYPGLATPQPKRVGQTRNAQTAKPKPKRANKDSIPISLIGQGPRFNLRDFPSNTTITLSVAQLLDRSPQIRTQVAKPQSVQTIGLAHPSYPTIIDDGFDQESEVVGCLYIEAYAQRVKVNKTLVDTGAVVELILLDLIARLPGLILHEMRDNWMVRLADDRKVPITQYALLEVIVVGIRVHITAYVLASTETFELLLSKNWMTRVRAVEDHGKGTLTIQGKSGKKITIRAAATDSLIAELIAEEEEEDENYSDNDDDLAEDELARLTEELDDLQYRTEKGQRQ
ncbi:MAG: hypothetical protein M1826_003449 [Phylliscum demangeonii]|nr:MAG: hypothetical protein M1826_003449 [Phylliscum demangeonii]